MNSPRSRKTLTLHELARFLALLAETGNFALACERIGRAKSGLYKRRIRDSLFDSECVAAVALFRMSSALAEGRGGGPFAERMVEGSAATALKTTGTLILTTYAGRPQLRRAVPGRLTQPSLETFLRTLAATGNVRFAARSVGVQPSSIHARRRRDPAFAAEIAAARDVALASLEMNLIEATGAYGDWFLNPPLDFEGRGTAEGGGGARDDPTPDPAGHFTTRMTVSQAINLVGRLQRKLDRGGV